MPFPSPTTLRAAAVLALAAVPLVAAPRAAFAQGTEEQQQACTPDAVKLCSDTIPDIGKTTACMKAHFSQLTPRCQAAFADATGGDKAAKAPTRSAAAKAPKAAARLAARKAEPRARLATDGGRDRPVRVARPEREARVPPRDERDDDLQRPAPETAAPEAAAPEAVPAIAPGYPSYPSPEAPLVQAPSPSSPRGQIARACRDGLIDSYTCSTTVPSLIGGPAY